jgi:hypothetical protein
MRNDDGFAAMLELAVSRALLSLEAQGTNGRCSAKSGPPTESSGGEGSGEKEHTRSGERHEKSAAVLSHAPMEVPTMVGPFDPYRFYRDLLHELETHALRGGTAFGFAVVMKRVALSHDLCVESHPLPRPSREERAELAWNRRQRGGV